MYFLRKIKRHSLNDLLHKQQNQGQFLSEQQNEILQSQQIVKQKPNPEKERTHSTSNKIHQYNSYIHNKQNSNNLVRQHNWGEPGYGSQRGFSDWNNENDIENIWGDPQFLGFYQYYPNDKYGWKFGYTKSKFPTQFRQIQSGSSVGVIILIIIIFIALIVGSIMSAIHFYRKRKQVNKQYNQTPQNFTEKPKLSKNQLKSLEDNQFQRIACLQKDVAVEPTQTYSGKQYKMTFFNRNIDERSGVFWDKMLKTDSYFQVEMVHINSEIQFGFVNEKHLASLQQGVQTDIGRIGVSINTYGHVQVMGQNRYQFKWDLDFGDVIGVGITKVDGKKRVWITKNGILLNPPTTEQIQDWLNKQQMNEDLKQTYSNAPESRRQKLLFQQGGGDSKQEAELRKKKFILPSNQSFKYHAVIWCWELFEDPNSLSKESIKKPSIVKVNVGGKIFRLRDSNLKSGLLADAYQKREGLGMLLCC